MYSYKNTIYMYNTYEDKDLFLCDISNSVIWRHCKKCQCLSFLYLIRDESGQNLARNLALTQEIIRRIWVNLSIFLNDPTKMREFTLTWSIPIISLIYGKNTHQIKKNLCCNICTLWHVLKNEIYISYPVGIFCTLFSNQEYTQILLSKCPIIYFFNEL